MRICEILLIMAAGLLMARAVLRPRTGLPGWWLVLALLLLLGAHVLLEGWRLQMVPVYAAVAALAIAPAIRPRWPVVTVLAGLGGLGMVGAGAVLSVVFPVFSLPAPIGPLAVGGLTLAVTGPNDSAIPVQLRYPAKPAPGRLPYVILPRFSGARSRLVETHAAPNAPVAGTTERWPLLILLPGWLGARQDNTVLAENLASQGFVVAAIDDVDLADPKPMDFSSQAAFDATMVIANSKVSREAIVAQTVLQAILSPSQSTSSGPFFARIDPNRTGVLGFSFGGAVAGEMARIDPRLRGALNMDGWMFGKVLDDWITQPFWAMSDDSPPWTEADRNSPDPWTRLSSRLDFDDTIQMQRQWQLHGATLMTIAGTHHSNFSDEGFKSPLRRFTGAGPIAPRRASDIIATYAAAFFTACFGGEHDPILAAPSARFPEVSLEIWPRPAPPTPAADASATTQRPTP